MLKRNWQSMKLVAFKMGLRFVLIAATVSLAFPVVPGVVYTGGIGTTIGITVGVAGIWSGLCLLTAGLYGFLVGLVVERLRLISRRQYVWLVEKLGYAGHTAGDIVWKAALGLPTLGVIARWSTSLSFAGFWPALGATLLLCLTAVPGLFLRQQNYRQDFARRLQMLHRWAGIRAEHKTPVTGRYDYQPGHMANPEADVGTSTALVRSDSPAPLVSADGAQEPVDGHFGPPDVRRPAVMIMVGPGASVAVGSRELAVALPGSDVLALTGAIVMAYPNARVIAAPGALVLAANGAYVQELPGSELVWFTNVAEGSFDSAVN